MSAAETDRIVHWLLSSLAPASSVFHVGQYCGEDWRASTAGCARASFHIVLNGACWLHFADGQPSVALNAGEAVFLLRDLPHWLSADPTAPAPGVPGAPVERRGVMQPLAAPAAPGAVGLACGFFEFGSAIGRSMVALFPDCVVVRHGDPVYAQVCTIFDLIRAEALRAGAQPSPLIDRLTELLLFYALRHGAKHGREHGALACGLAALMRRAEFVALIGAIIDAPDGAWTTGSMAAFTHMSRATFCKRFTALSGQPPAQFVTLLRMKIAGELLRRGCNIPRAAERVGYQSESAFAHAFKRATGVQPGAWRRNGAENAAPELALQ